MTNSRAASGRLEQIFDTTLSGTSNSVTFTPAIAIALGKYRKLFVYISGQSTATLALRMKISGLTSGYVSDVEDNDGGTVTDAHLSEAYFELLPLTILDAARTIDCSVEMTLINGQIIIHAHCIATSEGYRDIHGLIADTTIDSIEILTSTSTLAATTRITVYALT